MSIDDKKENKIYFCASIRGESPIKSSLAELILHLKTNWGNVLTEHIAYPKSENDHITDLEIYNRDMKWLRSSHFVIAECSAASLGVGYELGIAERLGKPVLILYPSNSARNNINNNHHPGVGQTNKSLSAMLTGNLFFTCKFYEDLHEAKQIMDDWLAQFTSKITSST